MISRVVIAFCACLLAGSLELYGAQAQAEGCTPSAQESFPVAPSHGDLFMYPNGLVLIYKGPDGTDVDQMWATLDGFRPGGKVAKTMCQQLGYDDGSMTSKTPDVPGTLNRTVWLSNIDCPVEYQPKHILRCDSSVNSIDSRDHSNDIHLVCSNPTTRTAADSGANTYVGQATLLPPTNALGCNRSRSYGAVVIKHYTWRWDYLRNDSTLSHADTDTICREMGYTHSVLNTLLTVGQSKLVFTSYSYKFSQFSRIKSSKFNCSESCQCIGCCYNLSNYTAPGQPDPRFDVLLDYDDEAIVLRCSFYTPVTPSTSLASSGGHRDVCEVLDGVIRDPALCPSDAKSHDIRLSQGKFAAIVASLGVVISILVVIVALRFVRRIYHRVRGYNVLPGIDGNGDGGNNNVAGNGGN